MKFRILSLAIIALAFQSLTINALEEAPWIKSGVTRAQWQRNQAKQKTGQKRTGVFQRFKNLTAEQKKKLLARKKAWQARRQASQARSIQAKTKGWSLAQKKRWLAVKNWQNQKTIAQKNREAKIRAMKARRMQAAKSLKRSKIEAEEVMDCRGGFCRLVKKRHGSRPMIKA